MPALFRRAGDRAAAPIRGPASLLYGGAAVKRSGAPLRLFGRGLPGAVPRFSPPRAAQSADDDYRTSIWCSRLQLAEQPKQLGMSQFEFHLRDLDAA